MLCCCHNPRPHAVRVHWWNVDLIVDRLASLHLFLRKVGAQRACASFDFIMGASKDATSLLHSLDTHVSLTAFTHQPNKISICLIAR